MVDGKCVSCSSNGNCVMCQGIIESSKTCGECKSPYTLNNNSCQACSAIHYQCIKCSQSTFSCLECKGNFILSGTTCSQCSEQDGMVRSDDGSTCIECHKKIDNCLKCTYTDEDGVKCTVCRVPYVQSNGVCVLCQDGQHYKNTMCVKNDEGCVQQVSDTCIQCNARYVLVAGKCQQVGGTCNSQSVVTCEDCQENVLTTNGNCALSTNCLHGTNTRTKDGSTNTSCAVCMNGYYSMNGVCEKYQSDECDVYQHEVCLKTKPGYYIDGNGISRCGSGSVCTRDNSVTKYLRCSDGLYESGYSMQCKSVGEDGCTRAEYGECTECDSGYIENGACQNITISSCSKQAGMKCQLCAEGYYLMGSICHAKDGVVCSVWSGNQCTGCNDFQYKDLEGCKEKVSLNPTYEHCIHMGTDGTCAECSVGFDLYKGECTEESPTTDVKELLKGEALDTSRCL